MISHKRCWAISERSSAYATDGGFPFQIRALSELFDSTVLLVPRSPAPSRTGGIPLNGRNLSIVPLTVPPPAGPSRSIAFPLWVLRNGPTLIREIRKADAIHALIPGDVGTIGMILAVAMGKRLAVRHCGNWLVQETRAEVFWGWFMTRFAGGRNVMLATGGAADPPSWQNPAVRWTFATTLTQHELAVCRAARQPSKRAGRLIMVCRQERRKGTAMAIESLSLILQDLPGATLDVVGAGTQLESLKDLATRLGLIDRVRFHGQVDHARVLDLLTQSDLLCYPTTCPEGFPKAVLEALACGVPVITSPVSVLPSIVRRGCGVLLDEVTPLALARAVRETLLDERRYHEMSERAMQIAAEYSLERWQASVGGLLRKAWGRLSAEGDAERPKLYEPEAHVTAHRHV